MFNKDAGLIDLDRSLHDHLTRVGLIGEIPLTEEDLELMAGRLRECLDTKGPGPGTEHLNERGARVVACLLVHLGVRGYREGDFWGAVAPALRRALPTNLQVRWGRMVEQVIKDYRLAPFFDPIEQDGQRYVTPILGHGGIPDYCLDDFFEKLLIPTARGRLIYDEGDLPHLLRQWEKRASDYQTADKPIRRFLRHGGKAARDFLDRCLDLAEAFDAGRLGDPNQFGLPERVVKRFREWSASQIPTHGGRESRASSGPRYRRPELFLDPASAGLRLVIPCQSILLATAERGRLTAFVRQDHVPAQEFELRPSSVNGRVDTAPIELLLRRSFAKLDVALRAGGKELRAWDLEGITGDRPWMAFDGETYQLVTERPLPKNDVWLLALQSMGFEGGDISEEAPVWGDFLARRVDLGTSNTWRLHETRSRSKPVSLAIESTAEIRPFLEGRRLPAWPPVSCPGCDFLFVGRPPELVIPAGHSGGDGWRDATLIVRSLDGQASAPTEWRRFPLSDLWDQPAGPDQPIRLHLGEAPLSLTTGRFLLNLRGRLGQDETYRIAVVPSMEIECPPECLLPDEPGGSHPITIQVRARPGTRIEAIPGTDCVQEDDVDHQINLGGQQRSVDLKVDGVELRITLPRIEWAFSAKEVGVLRYESRPIEIDLQEFEDAPEPAIFLKVALDRVPAARLCLDRGGQSRDVPWQQGRAAIPLGGFLDTIRATHGSLRTLRLAMASPEANGERSIEVLRIRHGWSCWLRSIETVVESGQRALFFTWEDQVRLPNRVIRLWRATSAPDHQPVEIPVGDGVDEIGFEVPEQRLPDGRYLLEFAVGDDGWNPPVKPDLFKEGLQVVQLDASSAELLGSPAGRLDELLEAYESNDPLNPDLRNRVVDDILAGPVTAIWALRDRGWVGLNRLFLSDGCMSGDSQSIEEIYGAISWSSPEFAAAFLRGLRDKSRKLVWPEGTGKPREVLNIELRVGETHPLAFPLRGRKRVRCVVPAKWHRARPHDWSPEVKRFVLSQFQRALHSGIASCPGDVRGRIEETGRQAFLSDPDDYLKAWID